METLPCLSHQRGRWPLTLESPPRSDTPPLGVCDTALPSAHAPLSYSPSGSRAGVGSGPHLRPTALLTLLAQTLDFQPPARGDSQVSHDLGLSPRIPSTEVRAHPSGEKLPPTLSLLKQGGATHPLGQDTPNNHHTLQRTQHGRAPTRGPPIRTTAHNEEICPTASDGN